MANLEKLKKDAAPALMAGEQVIDGTTGSIEVHRIGQKTRRNGAILVTDRRVVLFTKKLGGYDLQDFAYGLLSSVEHKKGMTAGNLTLSAAGVHSHARSVPKNDVERIAQIIRDKMAAAHGATHTAAAPSEDPADQIRKLAALRDEGHITADEFEAKKKQLLGL
jgi:Bacterial PH domain/Short C-terminal domain